MYFMVENGLRSLCEKLESKCCVLCGGYAESVRESAWRVHRGCPEGVQKVHRACVEGVKRVRRRCTEDGQCQ